MAIEGGTNKQVEEWLLDTSKYRKELSKASSEIRKQTKLAKDAALVQEHMAGSMSKAEKHLGSMGKSMVVANLASAALTKGFAVLKNSIGGVIETGLTWNDWIGDNAAALQGMQDATAGIIGKLDLVRARTKLTTGDFAATEAQLQALSKAAVIYARVVKVDLRTAIDALSDVVAAGRDTPLRRMGIDIELTGSKSEKAAKALEVLESKFGDVAIKAENANEKISQTKATLEDATGALGNAIIKSDLLQNALRAVGAAAKGLVGDLRASTQAASAFATGGALNLLLGASAAEDVQGLILRAAKAARDIQGQADIAATVKGFGGFGVSEVATGGKKGGGKGGKGKARKVSPGPEIDSGLLGARDREAAAAEELARQRQLLEITQQLAAARAEEGIAAQINANIAAEHAPLIAEAVRQTQAMVDVSTAAGAKLSSLGTGALQQFGAGILSAVEAAVLGQQSFGAAMAAMAKSAIMSLASQAIVEALMQTAFGIASLAGFMPQKAALHFSSAAVFGGIGVTAGALGIGLSAAGVGAPAGGGRGTSTGGGVSTAGGGFRPATGGSRRSQDQKFAPTIIVQLDAQNPAAGLQWKKLMDRN